MRRFLTTTLAALVVAAGLWGPSLHEPQRESAESACAWQSAEGEVRWQLVPRPGWVCDVGDESTYLTYWF